MTAVATAEAGRVGVRRALLIAVGAQACEAAEADRRGQGKHLLRVDGWPDVLAALRGSERADSALVVVPGEELTYAAVEALLDVSVEVGTPVGVLPIGRDGRLPGSRPQPAPPAPRAAAMYCHFRSRFDCEVEYGREEAREFLTRLTGGVEAAVFHAHGNGADLEVGSHVFCVQVDHLRGKPRPGDLTLLCQVGGPCRLEHLPLTAYWGASAMQARIVVLLSCWGYHPADGVLNPEVLFGTALLRGSTVEAFVASTRVTFNTPELAQATLAFLELGGTVGELTMLLNRFPGTATPPYICIGDPDVRVQRPDGRAGRHTCAGGSGSGPAPTPDPDDVTYEQLARLELHSRHTGVPAEARAEIMTGFGPLLKEGRPGRVGAATRTVVASAWAAREPRALDPVPAPARRYRAFAALMARHTGNLPAAEADAFWDFVHGDPPGEELDERWSLVQTRMLHARGPEQLGYLSFSSKYRNERLDLEQGPARHLCGNRMMRITVEFSVLDGYARELCFCERCGPVADVPAGMPAPFLVADGDGARVLGSPWDNAWVTTAIVPVGPLRFAASTPSRMSPAGPIPLPAGAEPGRRLGVALVNAGEHVLLETELMPSGAKTAADKESS
ncbi:hypothetical protein [Dactylosporangium sp. NPDC051541]|uniref:hypothetical protein n=1 Tax=Dactylosporangium sp. NPDC051541 TaxID=3363977 RepID=UPI0037BCB4B9